MKEHLHQGEHLTLKLIHKDTKNQCWLAPQRPLGSELRSDWELPAKQLAPHGLEKLCPTELSAVMEMFTIHCRLGDSSPWVLHFCTGSIPGLGIFPRERNGNPIQYSCLENSMDRGAWHRGGPQTTSTRLYAGGDHGRRSSRKPLRRPRPRELRAFFSCMAWCPTLCDPGDYSPSSSSVHRILQARILDWVAIPSFRGSS